MISGDTPKHLLVGAKSTFLAAVRNKEYPWRRIASQTDMTAKSEVLVDLGAAPMPIKSRQGYTAQDFIEKSKVLTVSDWDITVWISQNAIDDDQSGMLFSRVKSAGDNFQKAINARVFQVLNAGDSQTYGAAYDGQDFFDLDHADSGAAYQTPQDNEGNVVLTPTSFGDAYAVAQSIVDDQGQFTQFAYDLLVVSPALLQTAANITGNPLLPGTPNNDLNAFKGGIDYIVSPYLDTTAAYLIASSESAKPLIVAMRKEPSLQDTWFDPGAPDGGRWYFKYFGRYEVHYADWRLAYQINS